MIANGVLTAREQAVLDLRRQGVSMGKIGRMFGCSRQAVKICEQRALAKEGASKSVAKGDGYLAKVEYAAIYREKAQRVWPLELSHTDDVAPASWYKATRQAFVTKLERVIDRLVNELAEGKASAEWTWHRIAGIQEEMARA
jgi:DNA-binding CsgD family transcriptional regulator